MTRFGAGGEKVGEGELGGAEGVGEIYVQDAVVGGVWGVGGRGMAGRVPERRPGLAKERLVSFASL